MFYINFLFRNLKNLNPKDCKLQICLISGKVRKAFANHFPFCSNFLFHTKLYDCILFSIISYIYILSVHTLHTSLLCIKHMLNHHYFS